MSPNTRRLGVLTSGLIVAGLLVACSGGAPAEPEKTDAAGAADCVSAAQEAVAAATGEPEAWFPTDSDISAAEGESVWFVGGSSAQVIKDLGDAFDEAAAAAGMKPNVVYADGTAAVQTGLLQQAIAQNAAGIITNGDPAAFSNVLNEAEAAGIPVVWFAHDSSVDMPGAVVGAVPSDWYADGKLIAQWIMADSGCSAEVGLLRFPVLTSSSREIAGAVETLASECPSCTTYVQDVAFASLATDVPNAIRTVMTQHPDVKYWVTSYDAIVTATQGALTQVGAEGVAILGHDGVGANFDLIRQGAQAIDVALPPASYEGPYLADLIGTAIAGGDPRTEPMPSRLVDASNVGASGTELFPSFADALDRFEDAWGR